MSYLAIARKYRPATFEEMVGQVHVTRTLSNAIKSGRIHHAFLFTGARGVGKTTAARALARALNCEKGPIPEPCGECVSCREILSGSSPDLTEIDGASNNGVDDIRELRDTIGYAPTRGKYRIYLIDEVHMLSKAAFNALLKTLEEPPRHVVFIFATTEVDKIPDTILSRVQRFDFKRIGQTGVVDRLREIADREGVKITDGGLRIIARAGEGSMRDAQSLLDKVISFAGPGAAIDDAGVAETLGLVDRTVLFTLLQALVKGDAGAALDAVAVVHETGYELSQLTGELLDLVRDAAFLSMAPDLARHVELPAEEIARIRTAVDGMDPEVLGRLFGALVDVHDQVARSPRPRVVLEMAMARLATVRPVQPMAQLVGRLEALERRLRASGASASKGIPDAPPLPARRDPEPPAPPRPAARTESARTPAPREPKTASEADPAPAPIDPIEQRWARLAGDLRALGGPALSLLQGDPRFTPAGVVVELPAGRTLAEARRALRQPDVVRLVERDLPGQRLDAVAQAGTGTPADELKAIEQEVLQDPQIQRMIAALGAELESVRRDTRTTTPADGGKEDAT